MSFVMDEKAFIIFSGKDELFWFMEADGKQGVLVINHVTTGVHVHVGIEEVVSLRNKLNEILKKNGKEV